MVLDLVLVKNNPESFKKKKDLQKQAKMAWLL